MQPPPSTPPAAPPPAAPVPAGAPVRALAGLLLLPAGLGLLVGQVRPTLRTVAASFQERSLVPGATAGPTGLDNYRDVLGRETVEAYANAALLPLLPLVGLLVVGPLLAAAAHRAGRAGRWGARLVLAVPMVCFAPAAVAVAWLPADGLGTGPARTAFWLSTFGLAAGLGVTLYLAVLRGRRPGRSGWPAGVATGAVAGIAAVAVALPAFAYPVLLGATTPMPLLYRVAFQFAAFGQGAAHGTILFGVLLLLGLAAALVIVLSGLRLTIEPDRTGPAGGSVGAAAVTGLGLLGVLAVTGYGLWPWLSRLTELAPAGGPPAGTVLVNTWLPPLFSTIVGVGLAAVAGFGIGGLRPLGRWSELLLVPFAPWLFVGIGPLVVAKFEAAAGAGRFGDRIDTLPGLVPPIWLVVPALFLFTLLFRGLADRPRPPGGPAGYRRMLVAALPMLVLAGAATWLVQAQSLLWGLVAGVSEDRLTGPVLAARQAVQSGADGAGLGLVLPVPAVVGFAAGLALLQLLYLDRLAIRAGRSGPGAG
jgi:hypothetical protein